MKAESLKTKKADTNNSNLSKSIPSAEMLLQAVQNESEKFKDNYLWLEKAMPQAFFEEIGHENVMLIAHNLIGFDLQQYYSSLHLKNISIAMCLDSPDADLKILNNYAFYGIKNYHTFLSKTALPFSGVSARLRIAVIHFTHMDDISDFSYPVESKEKIRELVRERHPSMKDEEFETILSEISPRFIRSLPIDGLVLAFEMCFRAQNRDTCQYEVRYNKEWEKDGGDSMQIFLAWRNTPKHNFLYRIARIINRHDLRIRGVNACYINQYSKNNIFMMVLNLHGNNEKPVWEVADIPDFLHELVTVKSFASFDMIDSHLIQKKIVSGNMGNLLRAMVNFIHQALVHIDVHLYSLEHIKEGLCRHPEFTALLCEAFKYRFDPNFHNDQIYQEKRNNFLLTVDKLDTGNEEMDIRRQNILRQGMNFIHHTLKTNYYCSNYTALSFRLDPKYLDEIPFERAKKFPELPYGIIFVKGMHFFGFHIRFKDLARGGLRTVFPEQTERLLSERNNVFTECYNLAYTQQMKNKDIPEGGAKGIIFLNPYERLESEAHIYRNELQESKIDPQEIDRKVDAFFQEQKTESLYHAQRSFVENLLTLVICDSDGKIQAKNIIDYWKKPEYIYLGPDENMHDVMIQWIAEVSKARHYKPGSAFISGKPNVGINHKEYGVTSLGVNVYMEVLLKHIGIDPAKDTFTIKMSGGPDGDVAGNEICNLHRYYPNTAKLVAITDVSGCIYDPQGLDLAILVDLFKQQQAIRFYPPKALHAGGFILDRMTKRKQAEFVQQTLCWRMKNEGLVEDWLSGSEMNHLWRSLVHRTKADVFIPAGGRPRTLNEKNYTEYLDEAGNPTSKVIIEGANLYLDQFARRALEELGVLIIKDSSANKCGVICSSFEVLCGLTLGDDKFLANKASLVIEILARLKLCALNEVNLLLRTHVETGDYLTAISERISKQINLFTDQLLNYLDTIQLSHDPQDPLIKCFLDYCLPTLRKHFQNELLKEIPENHKKAIIACHLAAQIVYKKGLTWSPSIVDILPMLL